MGTSSLYVEALSLSRTLVGFTVVGSTKHCGGPSSGRLLSHQCKTTSFTPTISSRGQRVGNKALVDELRAKISKYIWPWSEQCTTKEVKGTKDSKDSPAAASSDHALVS